MKILSGHEKTIYIEERVEELTARILRTRPKSMSTQSMDIEIRQALIAALPNVLVLPTWDGHSLRFEYLPED